jgi:hypothetical protein
VFRVKVIMIDCPEVTFRLNEEGCLLNEMIRFPLFSWFFPLFDTHTHSFFPRNISKSIQMDGINRSLIISWSLLMLLFLAYSSQPLFSMADIHETGCMMCASSFIYQKPDWSCLCLCMRLTLDLSAALYFKTHRARPNGSPFFVVIFLHRWQNLYFPNIQYSLI